MNDDPLPGVSVADSTATETDAGTVNMIFTVSLSTPSGAALHGDLRHGGGRLHPGHRRSRLHQYRGHVQLRRE